MCSGPSSVQETPAALNASLHTETTEQTSTINTGQLSGATEAVQESPTALNAGQLYADNLTETTPGMQSSDVTGHQVCTGPHQPFFRARENALSP